MIAMKWSISTLGWLNWTQNVKVKQKNFQNPIDRQKLVEFIANPKAWQKLKPKPGRLVL
jgi:hypothetical protein